MRWAVVVGRYADRAAAEAREAFARRGVEVSWLTATDRFELGSRSRQALDESQHLFVVGGDGTINAVADAVVGHGDSPPIIGVLPAGTGSDFARMFAIPTDPEAAVARAIEGTDYPIDVGIVEGPWGRRVAVNEAEAGIGAATTELAERLPRSWGQRKYEVAFWGALPTFAPGHAVLETDRRTLELERGVLVVAANGEFFGGGMRVAPKASVVDGRFDLIVIEARRSKALTLFPRIKRGLHLTDPAVRRIVTASFRLTTDRPWPVEIDGDFVGRTPLEGRVQPAALTLRV